MNTVNCIIYVSSYEMDSRRRLSKYKDPKGWMNTDSESKNDLKTDPDLSEIDDSSHDNFSQTNYLTTRNSVPLSNREWIQGDLSSSYVKDQK